MVGELIKLFCFWISRCLPQPFPLPPLLSKFSPLSARQVCARRISYRKKFFSHQFPNTSLLLSGFFLLSRPSTRLTEKQPIASEPRVQPNLAAAANELVQQFTSSFKSLKIAIMSLESEVKHIQNSIERVEKQIETQKDVAEVKSYAITTQNTTTRLLKRSKYFASPAARLTPEPGNGVHGG